MIQSIVIYLSHPHPHPHRRCQISQWEPLGKTNHLLLLFSKAQQPRSTLFDPLLPRGREGCVVAKCLFFFVFFFSFFLSFSFFSIFWSNLGVDEEKSRKKKKEKKRKKEKRPPKK
ncbi:hypothetical protein I7I48_05457 [Histoplasma ohiense]|nr:hypothetical protein I7I48_05457 [Histoplasma ohiense (nom. inval.)]